MSNEVSVDADVALKMPGFACHKLPTVFEAAMVYAQAMLNGPVVIDYVIAEDPQKFPIQALLPDNMRLLGRFGSTEVWRLRRTISADNLEASPDSIIRREIDRLKLSHETLYKYLGEMQHWWPILHSTTSEAELQPVDAYTEETDVYVDWNYLLIRKSNPTQTEELVRIAAQMVARCYGLTEAIRSCQEIMSSIPDDTALTILQKSESVLESVRHKLLVDLVTSDARSNVYGSYAFETYSEIRQVWNLEEIEVSSQRCLAACEALIAKIRLASQSKREQLRADTLLFLTVISSVSAAFSFIDYIDPSPPTFDPIRVGVSIAIALSSGIIFWILRWFSSD